VDKSWEDFTACNDNFISLRLSIWIPSPPAGEQYEREDEMASFPSYPPFFETFMLQAREVSQEELRDIMKSHGYNVLIPHYIPHGIKFSAIYYKCCPLVVVIAYSDRGVKDYRFANITIEIAPFHPKFAPSKEYMQRLNSPQVVRGHNQRLCGSNHSKD
jgi:hypothetical protein